MGTIRMEFAALRALATEALTRAGTPEAGAKVTADILLEAELMDIPTHGLVRLPGYCERVRIGGIKAEPTIAVDRRSPALALVDGDNGLGPVVGQRGLEAACAIAAETGLAYAGCRNSNHFGAIMPYALRACEAGYVSIIGTNASVTMPPWGGKEARIGNNPLAIAAPRPAGPHFILDMAMSVAARGKIRGALERGERIPSDWAVDAHGRPTDDPAEALKGFLMPFGGHKGSGLSLAVDLLSGLLTGGPVLDEISSWLDTPEKPQGVGHFFILLDPVRLIGREAYESAMTRFAAILHATPPADPERPVRLPGEREQTLRRQRLAEGLEIPRGRLDELQTLTGRTVA